MTQISEISDAATRTMRPLWRFWWVVVLFAVAAGASTHYSSRQPVSETYGVVNTRSVTSLPNDRLDLINDLSTVAGLSSVLENSAEIAGMSVDELRDAIEIQRIGSTTLARVRFTTEVDDPEASEQVISTMIGDAADFLAQSPPGTAEGAPPAQLQAAEQEEQEASAAVKAAVEVNSGIEPDAEYGALANRVLQDQIDSREEVPRVQATRLEEVYQAAQDYKHLLLVESRARNAVTSLKVTYLQRRTQQAALLAGIPVSFEGDVPAPGDSVLQYRRTLASAAAGALLAVFLILALGRRRRGARNA